MNIHEARLKSPVKKVRRGFVVIDFNLDPTVMIHLPMGEIMADDWEPVVVEPDRPETPSPKDYERAGLWIRRMKGEIVDPELTPVWIAVRAMLPHSQYCAAHHALTPDQCAHLREMLRIFELSRPLLAETLNYLLGILPVESEENEDD